MDLLLFSSRFVGAAQHCQPVFGLRRLGGNWAPETGCQRPRSGTGRMRNGSNARELRAFFRNFVQELGNRQEHVTCWLPFLLTYRTLCLAPMADFFAVLEKARQLTPVQ